MSTPAPIPAPTPVTQITVKAHQSHWYDIFTLILKATQAANPILATIIPAPIEAGIMLGTTLAPVVAGTIQAATSGTPAPATTPTSTP
jgi:hypothetical protein